MAIWQFEFNIIHKTKQNLNKSSHDFSDKVISWEECKLEETSILKLVSQFPIEKSWCKDIVQYGNKDKTYLEFCYEKNVLVEILCRIDLRNIEKEEFNVIFDFINMNDALIFYNEIIYNISKNDLINLITESDAYKFCKAPREFFIL